MVNIHIIQNNLCHRLRYFRHRHGGCNWWGSRCYGFWGSLPPGSGGGGVRVANGAKKAEGFASQLEWAFLYECRGMLWAAVMPRCRTVMLFSFVPLKDKFEVLFPSEGLGSAGRAFCFEVTGICSMWRFPVRMGILLRMSFLILL